MLFGSALGAMEADDKTSNTTSKNKVTLHSLVRLCWKRYLGMHREISPNYSVDDGSYKVKVQARRHSFGVVTEDILIKNVAKPLLLFIWGEMITRNNLPLLYFRP